MPTAKRLIAARRRSRFSTETGSDIFNASSVWRFVSSDLTVFLAVIRAITSVTAALRPALSNTPQNAIIPTMTFESMALLPRNVTLKLFKLGFSLVNFRAVVNIRAFVAILQDIREVWHAASNNRGADFYCFY